MSYDIAGHVMLSPTAAKLGQAKREAEQRVAESVLGLDDTAYEDDAKLQAQDALAMQVSLQVSRNPREYLASSMTTGSRSISFKDGTALHPLSVLIVARLSAASMEEPVGRVFKTIRSMR